MKSKASTFLKQMLSTIVAVVKAKSTAVRAKTSAMKTRLLIFGLLRNRKLLATAINHKIHAIMGGRYSSSTSKNSVANFTSNSGGGGVAGEEEEDDGGSKKDVVLYSSLPSFLTERGYDGAAGEEEENSDDYLTHTLFQEEEEEDDDDELVNAPGSVIDLMRDAKEGEGGEFRLEDEIDHVADVFIRRIHKQLKLQKLDSFKRFCEMLGRSA